MQYRQSPLRLERLISLYGYLFGHLTLLPCCPYQKIWSNKSASDPSESAKKLLLETLVVAREIEVNRTPDTQ